MEDKALFQNFMYSLTFFTFRLPLLFLLDNYLAVEYIHDMDTPNTNMDTSNGEVAQRSTIFRTPLQLERNLGLWVDRLGHNIEYNRRAILRLLGLYAAVYIKKGDGTLTTPPTGELRLTTGDVFFLFPDVPHRYIPFESWDSEYIVWDGPEAHQLAKLGFMNPEQPLIRGAMNVFEKAYQQLSVLIQEEDHASLLERKIITEKLVLDLFSLRHYSETHLTEAKLVQNAVNFLQANAQEALSIPDMASQFNISSRQFQRLFKKYSGRNPREMVMTFRISQAKELLLHGASVKEAAVGSGYNDMFYFIRVFKKLTGDSPGKWRRKHLSHMA